MAQKGKPSPQPSKTAPDPTILALQEELKREGFYFGNPDGLPGEKTQNAVNAREEKRRAIAKEKADEEERALKRLELESKGETAKAAAADVTSKTRAREERQAQASSPAGIATQIAATTVAPLAGVGAGRVMGLGINALMDQSQASKNAVLQGVAADRVANLTTREGALNAAARSGALPSDNALLRVGGRMLPHLALGGFMAGKGGVLLSQEDPEGAFYPEMFNRGAALGMLGAGTGIAERGITYGVAPGVAPDAKAMAVIGSNQLRRNGAAQASAPAASGPRPVLPGSKADLMAQARRYGIKGRSNMTPDQLREAVGEAVKTVKAPRGGAATKMIKGLAGPAAAASLAYAMTPDRAEAADGSAGGGNTAQALTNAGIAGGAAYGVNRLLDKLPSAIGGAAGAAGTMIAPATIDSLTDYSDEDLAQGRNWLARNTPEALQFGAVSTAREMAQVPEPSPMRGQIAPSEMAGIDQGEAPDFDSQMQELQSLLAAIGAAQEPGPMANAVASQRVASMPQQQPMYQPQMPMPQRNALLR